MIVISLDSADSNILIHSIDASEGEKHVRARRLVERLMVLGAYLPLQALKELCFVGIRKQILEVDVIQAYTNSLIESMRIIAPFEVDLKNAMRLHRENGQQFFAALIFSTAARAACRTFFSEDLQHSSQFGQMRVVNPFLLSGTEFEKLVG